MPRVSITNLSGIGDLLNNSETVRVTDHETGNSSERTGRTSDEAAEKAADDVRQMNRVTEDDDD